MPRSGRIRAYIKEFSESQTIEKLSFIPPFLVLTVELILLRHALIINEGYIIALTTILLILSAVEIFLVSREIHEHYQTNIFDRILTIKLDDFILETKEKNVKKLVEKFIEEHQEYDSRRNEAYRITCQILETHEEETLEKAITERLNKIIKKSKKKNVSYILKVFMKKHPAYKKYRTEVYHKTCQLLEQREK